MSDIDLIERCSFYYNLLKHDVQKLKDVLQNTNKNHPKVSDNRFREELTEFGINDLRIVYHKQENHFIKPLEFFFNITKVKQKPLGTEENSESEYEDEDDSNESKEEEDFLNSSLQQGEREGEFLDIEKQEES